MSSIGLRLETIERLRIEIGGQWVSGTAQEIEALIAQLSKFREGMRPEVPHTLDNTTMQGPVDPIWAGLSHDHAEERFLSIRHPGIGWISFLFSRAAAKSLADYLTKGPQQSGVRSQSLQ